MKHSTGVDWSACYETLRRTALDARRGIDRPQGWALMVRRGMAGWMAACDEILMPPCANNPQPLPQAEALSLELQTEVTRLLASMALSHLFLNDPSRPPRKGDVANGSDTKNHVKPLAAHGLPLRPPVHAAPSF